MSWEILVKYTCKICYTRLSTLTGSLGFSKDFDLLKSGIHHPAVTAIREQAAYIGSLSSVPWLFKLIVNSMDILGYFGVKTSFNTFLEWCTEQVEARRKVRLSLPSKFNFSLKLVNS